MIENGRRGDAAARTVRGRRGGAAASGQVSPERAPPPQVQKMKAVWTDSDDATCIHPGHPLISGSSRVLNSWRALFMSGGMPQLRATRQKVVLRGEVAWVTCNEQAGDEPSALEALNVFERRDGRWLMIHHGAGPVFVGSKPE
mmetsp:Transcript_22640/g.67791  ORF Transcript_22640/g.67791 Transcript_22640/m.67791 type:complete len:143 (+) Transcript_22640:624-1052(+)